MRPFKPLSVPKLAWIGCKVTNATALWLAFSFRNPWLILVPVFTLGISALFGPRRAPLLLFYSFIDKAVRTPTVVVDEHALRFAHVMGSCFALLAFGLFFVLPSVSWAVVFVLALMITLGALGFCTATKLYGCMTSGTCCMRKK